MGSFEQLATPVSTRFFTPFRTEVGLQLEVELFGGVGAGSHHWIHRHFGPLIRALYAVLDNKS